MVVKLTNTRSPQGTQPRSVLTFHAQLLPDSPNKLHYHVCVQHPCGWADSVQHRLPTGRKGNIWLRDVWMKTSPFCRWDEVGHSWCQKRGEVSEYTFYRWYIVNIFQSTCTHSQKTLAVMWSHLTYWTVQCAHKFYDSTDMWFHYSCRSPNVPAKQLILREKRKCSWYSAATTTFILKVSPPARGLLQIWQHHLSVRSLLD